MPADMAEVQPAGMTRSLSLKERILEALEDEKILGLCAAPASLSSHYDLHRLSLYTRDMDVAHRQAGRPTR